MENKEETKEQLIEEIKVLRSRLEELKDSESKCARATKVLGETNLFNEALVATIPFGMDIVSEDGDVLFMNEKLKIIFGENSLKQKCWELYKDDKTQCVDCPLKTHVNIGETKTIESKGCFDGKTLLITHTGMLYNNKRAVMEIFQDITERKKAEEALKELDKRKSDFVANVSHEFKSPLAVIKESMELVIDGTAGEVNPKQKEILERGKRTIERLIRLVFDLLDLSKIEAGKIEIKREKVDILLLAEDILSAYETELSKKRIIFKKDIPADIGFLWADHDKISQAIINILNNSIKFTLAGGSIAFKVEGSDKNISFEISDTGPGIPKEYFQKIFDKFERITAEKQEGTGLGLPIAKDIVELHKGKIWVESEVGKGSKFIFTLPRDLRM